MAEYRPTDVPNLNGWISSLDPDYTGDILRTLSDTTEPCILPEDLRTEDFLLEAWDPIYKSTSSSVSNCFSLADSSETTECVNDSDSNSDTKEYKSVENVYRRKRNALQMLDIDDTMFTEGGLPQPVGTIRKYEKCPRLTEQSNSSLLWQNAETTHCKTARLSSQQAKQRKLCMSQNAVNARQNRMKKKRHEEDLETTVEQLKKENAELRKKYDKQMEIVQNLSTQVEYLNRVVANADKLGLLLRNIPNCFSESSGAEDLSNNACTTKKLASIVDFDELYRHDRNTSSGDQNIIGFDHNYACLQPRDGNLQAGVCLHVATNGLAVEMCAICSQNAQKTFGHLRSARR